MADRRMISKKIAGSARFLKMPTSTRELYFQLVLYADDDGVVEAFSVMRMIGASEDDLKLLVAKGFIMVLDSDDLIMYITDWKEQNYIRADRKVNSRYINLLVSVVGEDAIVKPKPRVDVARPTNVLTIEEPIYVETMEDSYGFYENSKNGQSVDGQRTTNGQPTDGIGKDRLGKVSLVEDSLVENREDISDDSIESPYQSNNQYSDDSMILDDSKKKRVYGEMKNVSLTDKELKRLQAKFPDWQARIDRLSLYIASKGKKYKSHYATICQWAKRDAERQQISSQYVVTVLPFSDT